MTSEQIRNEYFEYLYQIVCGDEELATVTWRQLLWHLFNTPFRISYIIRDEDRAINAKLLRFYFGEDYHYNPNTVNPLLDELEVSVLEVMVDLSLRIERNIMASMEFGDRTSYWFWCMVDSLGLNGMIDGEYDPEFVDIVLERFMDREYEPNGKGSLFYIPTTTKDLRKIEIWYQACEYLNALIDEGRE